MQAVGLLHAGLSGALENVHAKRQASVFFGVEALLASQRLSLTSLGRASVGSTTPKHTIKRVDRLLGNQKLHAELKTWFGGLARWLIKPKSTPLVLIDWTKLVDGFWSLSAAVPFDGRALPIYWEVHRVEQVGNVGVQSGFLEALKQVVPDGSRPVIVCDGAGYFKKSWMRQIEQLGWVFVTRLTSDERILTRDGTEGSVNDFASRARRGQCTDLGVCDVYTSPKTRPFRVAVAPRFVRNRTRKPYISRHKRGRSLDKAIKRNSETWVLASNAMDWDGDNIVNIYRLRMQIEESYRDTKNPRFGWALDFARSDAPERWVVLLLIASLAMLVSIMVGTAAEAQQRHRGYQANTEKTRVLSLFTLGCQMLRRRDTAWLTGVLILRTYRCIQESTQSLSSWPYRL